MAARNLVFDVNITDTTILNQIKDVDMKSLLLYECCIYIPERENSGTPVKNHVDNSKPQYYSAISQEYKYE